MITFHADDYGVNIEQSMRILSCKENGVLNSVSIMPNSNHLEECVALLDNSCKKSIHINLAEGCPCAEPSELPLLVKSGRFNNSFLKLVLMSFIKRQELEREVEIECSEQIRRVTALLGSDYAIRIDSHIHYHMIPAVFRGLCIALKQSEREVEYIRYPVERLLPYIMNPVIWKYINSVNIIKCIILNYFGVCNKRTLNRYGFEDRINDFIGVIFTGKMTKKCVEPVLLYYKQHFFKEGKENLEILFHPGGIYENEEYLDIENRPYVEFYCSPNRKIEENTLRSL